MCANLIPGNTYYEYSIWVLKPGMTPADPGTGACPGRGLRALRIHCGAGSPVAFAGKMDVASMKGVQGMHRARRSVPRLTEAAESGMDGGVPAAVDGLRGLAVIRRHPCRAVRGRGS
jgi:hypothetical protein